MNRQYRNEPLQNLPYEAVEGLQLRAIDLELNHELEYPGQPIRHVFLSGRGGWLNEGHFSGQVAGGGGLA